MKKMTLYPLKCIGKIGTCFLLVTLLLTACKDDVFTGKGPYQDNSKKLIEFKDARPDPEEGPVGTEVTYQVKGLDSVSDFTFYLNQEEAEVVDYSDSTITVKVPENASSGAASIITNNQSYFGPIFQVDGKVAIAISFDSFNGADGFINQIVKKPGSPEYFIVGKFTDYENNSASDTVNNIAVIDYKGDYQGILNAGKGPKGTLSTLAVNPNSQRLFIGGSFSSYNIRRGINNITRLNSDGSLDSMTVDLINLDPEETPNAGKDTVPTFNGGMTGGPYPFIVKIFFDAASKEIYALGNFRQYLNVFYKRSTKGVPKYNQTEVNNMVKLTLDGAIDSTFNFDPGNQKSYQTGNGFIQDAVRTSDGNFIIVGDFTTFNGKEVNYVTKIKADDGTIDPSFNTGSGADARISRVTYNEKTGKIILIGAFNHFNGEKADGVVMLNEDGSTDTQFKLREMTKGRANYAGQLDNGLIIVSGRFLKYDGVVRSGFMILNPDGSLADGYNNTGAFVGQINDMVESEADDGNPGVILVGRFGRFNNVKVGNVVKIEFKP